MKKGFTLIELLGVIVILGLIALIAIPTINSSLNASKSKAYDEQITTIENVARTYMSKKSLLLPNQIVGSHTCIKVSDLKKAGLLTTEDLNNPKYKEGSSREDEKFKTFNGGVVVTYTKQNKYNYKYSNDLEKCEAGWGDKESGDTAIPNLSISVSFNTNYITVVANASADSGIVKYEFSKDNGTTWIDNGTEKIYTFKNLTHGTSYNIKVRVTSGAGKQNTAFKRVVIPSIDKPTFKESGTSVKTVTITYPAGCGSVYTCSYVKDNGSSVTVATSTVDVPFTDSGSLVARVSDGTNAVSSSYTVKISFSISNLKKDVVATGDGLYPDPTEEGKYVYKGGNPNNYIKLGSDMYRIISIETDGTIKVIKNDIIGTKAFDVENSRYSADGKGYCTSEHGCKVWGSKTTTYDKNGNNVTKMPREVGGTLYNLPDKEATLNTYLNNDWYNSLDSSVKSKIVTHMFNVGVIRYYGDSGLTDTLAEEATYKWKGKVGLMLLSDFIKASTSEACKEETDYSFVSQCYEMSYNWLHAKLRFGDDKAFLYCVWMNSPSSDSDADRGVYATRSSLLEDSSVESSCGIAPVFYLSSDVMLSGDGTLTFPYQLD